MMHHKSEDYKEQAVKYYLVEDNTQEEVCRVFECSRRSLTRWVEQYKKVNFNKMAGIACTVTTIYLLK